MEAPDGSEIAPPAAPAYRVISESVAHQVRGMLTRVVEEGTGKAARIEGIQVAGKTGTAEKLPERKEVTSSFIAFAPADHPALLVLVVVDEPQGAHYASKVAAPHVKAILERGLAHLGILKASNKFLALGEEGSR
jgi:cell division protein FtsI/penicillin-binding protein 2